MSRLLSTEGAVAGRTILRLLDECNELTRDERRSVKIQLAHFDIQDVSPDAAFALCTVFRTVDGLARAGLLGDDQEAARLMTNVGRVWQQWLDGLPTNKDAYLEARRHQQQLTDLSRPNDLTLLLTWPDFRLLALRLNEFSEEDPAKKGVVARLLRATRQPEPLSDALTQEATTWVSTAPSGYIEILRGRVETCVHPQHVDALKAILGGRAR